MSCKEGEIMDTRKFYDEEAKIKMHPVTFDDIKEVCKKDLIISLIPKGRLKVLDIGCGDGIYSNYLKNNGYLPVGMDISYIRLKRALSRYSDIPFVLADIINLPFKKRTFDIALAIEVLEHIDKIDSAFRELKRISAKIIFTVPNKEEIRIVVCQHCGKRTSISGHVHSFDKKFVERLARRNGLKLESFKEFGGKFSYPMSYKSFNWFFKLPYRSRVLRLLIERLFGRFCYKKFIGVRLNS